MQLDTGIGARTVELANARASALAQHAAVEDQRRVLAEVRAPLEAVQGKSNRLTGELQAVRARQQANTGERVQLDASRTALAQAQSALKQVDLEPAAQVDELRSFLQSLVPGWEGQELRAAAACPELESQDRLVSSRVQIQVESQIGRAFRPSRRRSSRPLPGSIPRLRMSSRPGWHRCATTCARRGFSIPTSGIPSVARTCSSPMWRRRCVPSLRRSQPRSRTSRRVGGEGKRARRSAGGPPIRAGELAGKAQRIERERGELDDIGSPVPRTSPLNSTRLQKQAGLEQGLQQLTVARDQLSNEQTAIRAELDKIETRLNSIQSPFGTLPVPRHRPDRRAGWWSACSWRAPRPASWSFCRSWRASPVVAAAGALPHTIPRQRERRRQLLDARSEVDSPAVGVKHRLVHHLRERRVREDGVHQVELGRLHAGARSRSPGSAR